MLKSFAVVVSVLLLAPAGAISFSRGDGAAAPSAEDKLVALQPVLEKLKNLDPKTFGMLSGMITQAEGKAAPRAAFLQYLRDSPEEVEAKMQRLGPILDKLKSMDSKTFGALSGFLGQAEAGPASQSWESLKESESMTAAQQAPRPEHSWDRVALAAPQQDSTVVDMAWHRGDEQGSKSGEGTVVDIKLASELQEKESFLQARERKVRNAPGVEAEVAKEQQEDVYIHDEFAADAVEDVKKEKEVKAAVLLQTPNEEALQQVLSKLKGLDGKAFGALSSMIAQAQAQAKHQ